MRLQKRALRRASRQINKMSFCANKTCWNTDLCVFTERSSVFKESQMLINVINVNEELSEFKVFVIEEFNALKSSFLAEVHSLKKRHLFSCGKDVSAENVSECLIKQLQEDIMFLRGQLKNKDEVIHSLVQQLAKCDNVVECNDGSSHETSNKIHCSLLSNHEVYTTKYHP